jgi:hypothetical protein
LATFSNYLGLKLNSQTDPFLLSDFVANWSLIDASPGINICTSSTRPSLSTGQAGMLIFMSDLKQLSYWNGTSWQDLRDSSPVFSASSLLNTAMAKNTSPTFTILNLTTPRASSLAVIMSANYLCNNEQSQDLYQSVLVDGTSFIMGHREQIRFTGNLNDSGNTAGQEVTSLAIVPTLAAGTHTVGIKVDMSNSYPTPVTLYGVKILAFIALYSGTNSL